MRGTKLLHAPAALLLTLFVLSPTASAGGTITTTGSTIAAGTAPVQGTKTIEPAAPLATPPALPTIDPLGSIGTISGSIPAYVGVGGAVAFVGSPPTQTLPGGTYTFSTYSVPPGTAITYTGAVTIQTAGDVQIDGLVTTATAGASITFQCGGNLRIISHTGTIQTGVTTTAAASPIVLDVSGSITASSADTSTSLIDATTGAVSLTGHTNTALLLGGTTIRSRSAAATVQSAGSVALPAGTVRADVGDVTIQAYGGIVALQSSTLSAGNNLLVESSSAVMATAESIVGGQSTATVNAFGGDVTVSGGGFLSQTGGTGDVTVRASGNVSVSGASMIQNQGTGDIVVTAFGGGVSLEGAGSSSASVVRNYGSRNVALRASGTVLLAGASLVSADNGNVTLRSTTADIALSGDSAVQAPSGLVDARAFTAFTSHADAAVSSSAFPALTAQSILVVGGAAGIALDADPVAAQSGALVLIASGPVTVNADLSANGTVSIQSTGGDVGVAGRTITTGSAGSKSGDILVESFGGSSATIDATNATIRSGDHAVQSGDVALKIHTPGAVVVASGAIVPRQVKVHLRRSDLTKSRLTANGVLDTGAAAVELTGAATLTVGALPIQMTLAADGKGRPSFHDANVSLVLTPSGVGSSKTAFALTVTGDFRGLFDGSASGELALEFQRGALDARGTVRVSNSVFVRSKRRATLVAPVLYVASAHATLKSGAKDSLDLVAGFSTDGSTPPAAPDVTVAFGPNFAITVLASAFKTKSAGRFVASDPAHGVQSIVLDYKTETVTFHGRKIELDPPASGLAIPLDVQLVLGSDARGASIRVAHRGSAIIY